MAPTYNQASGTASNIDILVNRTETAIGSGTQRLISAGTGGGTYVEKFGVSNTGIVSGTSLTLLNGETITNAVDGIVNVEATTLTVSGVAVKLNDTYYAEIWAYDYATPEAIIEEDVYQAIICADFALGNANGFTLVPGITGPITSFATSDGGTKTIIEDAAHGMTTGDYITIVGTTNYDGKYQITEGADAGHFVITAAYVAEAGGGTCNWQRGAGLKAGVGSAGVYKVTFNASCSSVGADIYKLEANKNVTELDNIVSTRKFPVADLGGLYAHGMVTIADGDVIWLAVMNTSGADDLTIVSSNLSLVRL